VQSFGNEMVVVGKMKDRAAGQRPAYIASGTAGWRFGLCNRLIYKA
jgi:hypothetical protein